MNNVYIHPTALVDTDQIGNDTRLWAFVHVLKGAIIGNQCNIGDHTFIEGGVVIGNQVTVKNGNAIYEGVTIEDGAFIGPAVIFTNDHNPRSPRLSQIKSRYETHEWCLHTIIKKGASLGAGSIILPGLTIGEYALVGAGAVVTKDVLPYAVVIGNPARQHGWACQCGELLPKDEPRQCTICGLTYSLVDGKLFKS